MLAINCILLLLASTQVDAFTVSPVQARFLSSGHRHLQRALTGAADADIDAVAVTSLDCYRDRSRHSSRHHRGARRGSSSRSRGPCDVFIDPSVERDMSRMRKQLDNIFRVSTGFEPYRTSMADFSPRVDVLQTDDEYIIDAELPGVAKEDAKVTVKEGVLKVEGHKTKAETRTGVSFMTQERSYGKFSRSWRLPDNVDMEGISASFRDGILRITLNKTPAEPEPEARSIPIAVEEEEEEMEEMEEMEEEEELPEEEKKPEAVAAAPVVTEEETKTEEAAKLSDKKKKDESAKAPTETKEAPKKEAPNKDTRRGQGTLTDVLDVLDE
mmetsp:Transcript_39488/g.112613  ORF Transcript_39488/g.112613 Transcript_39488/m.112613 type:complete len:327 (+) Transcript_39488:28-1008(+)